MGRPLRIAAIVIAVIAITAAVVGLGLGAVHLGRDGPTAGAWARLHPREALAADTAPVATAIQRVVQERGRPPRHSQELLDSLDGAAFTYLRRGEAGELLDPWGRPMLIKIHHLIAVGAWSVRVYSAGPDGADDAGFNDDIEMELGLER